MAIKPILFNTQMVQAILEGRKTVTRRVIKPQPRCDAPRDCDCGVWNYGKLDTVCNEKCMFFVTKEPPFFHGDIIYVREIWNGIKTGNDVQYWYKADNPNDYDEKWRPSIHMPREAARIWLRVTDVRVERLKDITTEQAIKEGCEGYRCSHINADEHGCTDCYNTGWLEPPEAEFSLLWDSTIKKSDIDIYGWTANPYVWVIEFEQCEKPEGV